MQYLVCISYVSQKFVLQKLIWIGKLSFSFQYLFTCLQYRCNKLHNIWTSCKRLPREPCLCKNEKGSNWTEHLPLPLCKGWYSSMYWNQVTFNWIITSQTYFIYSCFFICLIHCSIDLEEFIKRINKENLICCMKHVGSNLMS